MSGNKLAVVTGGSIAYAIACMSALPFGPRIVFDAPDRSGGGGKTAAELAAEFKRDFESKHDKVKEIAEKALAEAEKGTPLATTAKELADEAIKGMNDAKARLDEIDQKMAHRGGGEDGDFRTAGERFVENEDFKAFAGQNRPRGRVLVEVKDITSLTTDAPGSAGALVPSDRRGMQVEIPQRRMTVRALLMPGQTSSNSIEYEQEKLFTNNAAPVAEGAAKPQSELQFEDKVANVRTIAHWMRTSVQILADAPGLRSIIDQRLRYGLSYVEENQLLNGSGTGQNLLGLVTAATAYAAPGGLIAATQLDTVRLMILQAALAEYPPNGIVMNPIDMAAIEMAKDDNGNYIIGNPQGTIQKTLWGLPVVETQAMGVDKALVGAFNLAAQIFDRQDATVDVSTEDQDNFIKNKVTIRAEERLAMAIYRPQAIVYGDLGRVA
ncbi:MULTISPECIES: phage major capsid protein [Agrobacterium]|uniref:phage major capsid protein n=1 Tax=Agrobacterium TaxID=357 RepID=UPI002783C88F|nr:phage major capsid protein [Agrobacterium sp. SORGH_AS_0745]MDP9758314.1 HK97 family phage major capsid protein [Agrobacterium tumefaciens]MDQ1219553.1 HK97 family phage major capsid protein [Agrobacterium sp. SORGH_AS_0745]